MSKNNKHILLLQFLEKAKNLNFEVEPVKILRSNTYQIGKSNILIRAASDIGKRYFFGLNYIHAEEIFNLENSFVAFICGSIDRTVFIPSEVVIHNLSKLSHDRNGEYKINFTKQLELVLSGRNNRLKCDAYANNWNLLLKFQSSKSTLSNPDESFHYILQGRLLEIGNIRGYFTYCPNKRKKFNKVRLDEIAKLNECPQLQYSNQDSTRNIDVIWFREVSKGFYPEYAFEVELSTGIWSGFGRLATLRDYNTKMYIITNDDKKFNQVSGNFPEIKERYINIEPDKVGLLYSAEKNLIKMREEFKL
jgi:hypothetical protein